MFGGGRLRKRSLAEQDIDLIPVMNLFITMIPFLLLGVSFYQLAGIPSTVPTQATDGDSDVAAEANEVTLTLGMSHERGYVLSASGRGVAPEELQALARVIPKRGEDFDNDSLSSALLEIKRRYDKSDTVIIVPEGDVVFQDLVRAMDASREVVVSPEGKPELAPRLALFPRVVLSRKL